jgi:DNA polymerase I
MIIADYEEDVNGEDVVLHIFERDEKSERKHRRIKDFRPYFYVRESENINDSKDSIVDTEYGFEGLEGEDLKKVICRKPSDVGRLRSQIEKRKNGKTWESDVHYPTRYAIDEAEKNDNGDLKKNPIRKCFLDIEVKTENNKFPDPSKANQPVICLTVYDDVLDKYIVFVWRDDKPEDQIEKEFGTVYQFNDERKMLHTFIEFIQDTNPDILAGWNVDSFDMQYLVNRMKNLELNFYNLSPIGDVEIDDKYGQTEVKIGGRNVFDQLQAYKFMNFGKEPSYKLDDIGEKEVGSEKVKFEETITELWTDDYETLIEYNVKDVQLCVDIDDEMDMIEFVDEVRRFTYCDFDVIFTPMLQVYSYVLRKAYNWDTIIPRQTDPEPSETSGGFVINPKQDGLVEDVAVADLKSLYPSLIITANMSPETLVENGQETDRKTIELNEDQEIYEDYWSSEDYNSVNTQFLHHDEKLGFLPKVLDSMFDMRAQYKDKMKKAKKNGNQSRADRNDRKQRATKVIMNTIYGVLSNKGFNLYRPEIADSITWLGRTTIKWSEQIIEDEFGCPVIYGDTDSVFFQCDSLENSQEIIDRLNESYDDLAEGFDVPVDRHRLFIEFEKKYERIFFGQDKKKRYAGMKTHDDSGSSICLEFDDRTMVVDPDEEFALNSGKTKKAKNIEPGDDLDI